MEEKASKSQVIDELLAMLDGTNDYTQLPAIFRRLSIAATASVIIVSVGFNPITRQFTLVLPPDQLPPDVYQQLAEGLQRASQHVFRLALFSEQQPVKPQNLLCQQKDQGDGGVGGAVADRS